MYYEDYRLAYALYLLEDVKEIRFDNLSKDWFFHKVSNQTIRIREVTICFRSLHFIEEVIVKGCDEHEKPFECRYYPDDEEVPLSVRSLSWELLRAFYATGIMNQE